MMNNLNIKQSIKNSLTTWKGIKCFLLLSSILIIYTHIAFKNYLLFHTLAESFSIFIASSIAMVAINTRKIAKTDFFNFLGLSFAFIAGFDLLHALTYKGIGIFNYGANISTQLWIIARFFQAISLLISFLFIKYRFDGWILVPSYLIAGVLLVLDVFYWNTFPTAYIEGVGLTRFKIISEILITIILFTTIILIVKFKEFFHKDIGLLLIFGISSSIISELFFIIYIDIYGISNMIGHLFKIIAFYFFYRAISKTNLQKPYKSLFYQINQYNKELKKKSLELEIANKKLKDLSLKDSLTGLYNRTYFEEETSKIELFDYETVAILVGDLDGLKKINDTLGHHIGDKYIKISAEIIRDSLRDNDIICRIGGDEFATILYNVTEEDMKNIVDRIHEKIDSYNEMERIFNISISLGYEVTNKGERNFNELFKKADTNMYKDKMKNKDTRLLYSN